MVNAKGKDEGGSCSGRGWEEVKVAVRERSKVTLAGDPLPRDIRLDMVISTF